MGLLLSANFFRLRRSAAFWVSMAVMAGIGVFEVTAGYFSARELGMEVPLENRYFIFALLSGIVLSAFSSLFLGTEYSDGAVRNKIIAGHPRSAVYLASLLTSAAVGVLLCCAYILAVLALGIPLLGFFRMELRAVGWFTVCVLVMTAALAALFTLVSMLSRNKAAAVVIALTLAYLLLFLGIYFNSRLTEPEMIPAREYIENGQILLQAAYPNPGYVRGAKRAVYEFLYSLPGCQAVWLAASADRCPLRLPLTSLLSALVLGAAGAALFRRRDLK